MGGQHWIFAREQRLPAMEFGREEAFIHPVYSKFNFSLE